MSASSLDSSVEGWFASATTASMELPDGWFGRPYDNMHRLTWATGRPDKLLLELDGQLYLILSSCAITQSSPGLLELQCDQAVFDWRTYGSAGELRSKVYPAGGRIRFHASGA
jgi:hypothetical protein